MGDTSDTGLTPTEKGGKKKIWMAGIGIILLLLLLLFLLFRDKERIVSVLEYEGTAGVEREGLDENLSVFAGMRLEEGDYVETGRASSVTMSIDDDKVARLAENSRASYREIADGRSGRLTNIYLEKGTLINDLENKLKKNELYKVTTPNATVSVRGTYFVVYVGPEEGYDGIVTRVNVYKGSVEVENASGEVRILYADDSAEYGMKSMITLPYGNRAIIGLESITIYKGLDYKGLSVSDLDRLKTLAGLEDSAVTLEDIEAHRRLLTGSGSDGKIDGGAQGQGDSATKGQEDGVTEDGSSLDSTGEGELARELENAGKGLREKERGLSRDEKALAGREKIRRLELPELELIAAEMAGGGLQPGGLSQTGSSLSGLPQSDTGTAGGTGGGSEADNRPSGDSGTGGSSAGGSGSGSSGGDSSSAGGSGSGSSGGDSSSAGGSGSGSSGGNSSSGGSSGQSSSSGSSSDAEAQKYAPMRLSVTNSSEIRQQIAELKGRAGLLEKAASDSSGDMTYYMAKLSIEEAEAKLDSVDHVNLVLDKINALPLPSRVTAASAPLIADARSAYDALTDDEKAMVPANLLEKLEKCEVAP